MFMIDSTIIFAMMRLLKKISNITELESIEQYGLIIN